MSGISQMLWTGGNPWWPYAVLVMNMDGAIGQTYFTDACGHPLYGNSPNPSVNADVPYPAFNQSMLCPGSGASGYTAYNSHDFELPGDYWIQFWFKSLGDQAGYPGGFLLCMKFDATGDIFNSFNIHISTSGGVDTVEAYLINSPTPIGFGHVSRTWHHLAIGRQGSSTYTFIDGVGGLAGTHAPGLIAATSATGTDVMVGSFRPLSYSGNQFHGLIDDLVILKGVCRHTSNFTPDPYPFRTF